MPNIINMTVVWAGLRMLCTQDLVFFPRIPEGFHDVSPAAHGGRGREPGLAVVRLSGGRKLIISIDFLVFS